MWLLSLCVYELWNSMSCIVKSLCFLSCVITRLRWIFFFFFVEFSPSGFRSVLLIFVRCNLDCLKTLKYGCLVTNFSLNTKGCYWYFLQQSYANSFLFSFLCSPQLIKLTFLVLYCRERLLLGRHTMAFTTKQMSLIVATFGVLSFIFGVIAENNKVFFYYCNKSL